MFIELNDGQILNIFKISFITLDTNDRIKYIMENGLEIYENFNSINEANDRMSEIKNMLLKG